MNVIKDVSPRFNRVSFIPFDTFSCRNPWLHHGETSVKFAPNCAIEKIILIACFIPNKDSPSKKWGFDRKNNILFYINLKLKVIILAIYVANISDNLKPLIA